LTFAFELAAGCVANVKSAPLEPSTRPIAPCELGRLLPRMRQNRVLSRQFYAPGLIKCGGSKPAATAMRWIAFGQSVEGMSAARSAPTSTPAPPRLRWHKDRRPRRCVDQWRAFVAAPSAGKPHDTISSKVCADTYLPHKKEDPGGGNRGPRDRSDVRSRGRNRTRIV
jgi:hypothetical protein